MHEAAPDELCLWLTHGPGPALCKQITSRVDCRQSASNHNVRENSARRRTALASVSCLKTWPPRTILHHIFKRIPFRQTCLLLVFWSLSVYSPRRLATSLSPSYPTYDTRIQTVHKL